MERLKPQATTVFIRLIDKMKACNFMKIVREDYHDLILERLEVLIHTPSGTGKLYRLAHLLATNSPHVADPEMTFLVIDSPKYGTLVIPLSYKAMDGEMETGIQIRHNRVTSCIKELQAGHASFANVWLRNIYSQGFLSASMDQISIKLVA